MQRIRTVHDGIKHPIRSGRIPGAPSGRNPFSRSVDPAHLAAQTTRPGLPAIGALTRPFRLHRAADLVKISPTEWASVTTWVEAARCGETLDPLVGC